MHNSLFHPVKIGSLCLDGNIFLAPMAGYTDRIFRCICLKNGASLAYTEMVSAEGAYRAGEGTLSLMTRGETEKMLAVQLFMPDEDTAERCIENVLKFKPDLIDINCGCPVPKVIKTGCGSALLKDPKRIGRIVRVLVNAFAGGASSGSASSDGVISGDAEKPENCASSKGEISKDASSDGAGKPEGDASDKAIPVTVKIRTGWDLNSINYLETASEAFEAGASAVCMHARTRSQLYMPVADRALLKDLKKHFPDNVIIGSGDLFTAYDVLRMLEETGVDAASIARGAIGNPFIFNQTKELIHEYESKKLSLESLEIMEKERRYTSFSVPLEVKKRAIADHLNGLCAIMSEERACREMRKHVCMYIKGIPGGNKVKNVAMQACTLEDYLKALELLGVDS